MERMDEVINADQIMAANCFSSKQGSVQKKTEKSHNGQKVGYKNTEILSSTKNPPSFSVLTTMRRPQLLDVYSAAVKTLESAVNHDWCPKYYEDLPTLGDSATKYKRCHPALAITYNSNHSNDFII